ncbi:MAG: TRAP transporter substrate-binding protein DctP [Gammaproteobacteria bacterium]|nr:TRAP transporter substrate-binding protein DctP [Gammaproteobacteria bacterium]
MPNSNPRLGLIAVLLALTAGFPAQAVADVLYGRAVAFAQPNSVWDQEWQRTRQFIADREAVHLDFFTRGERGSEEQMLHDLRRGRAHLGGMSLQGLASVVPELNIPMAPYVFDSVAEVDFVYDNHLFEIFDALFAERNPVLLQWVEVGWNGIYSNTPVRLPEDAAGLRLRGSPNPATQLFLKAVGADSIPLGSADLVPSLQTGLIEGGVSSVIFHYFVTRRYASHLTPSRHSYDTGAIVANKAWFDGADAEQQEILRGAWGNVAQARAAVRALTGSAVARMREEGIVVHEPDAAARERWRERVQGIVPALIARIGGDAQGVHEAVVAGKRAFALRAGGGP